MDADASEFVGYIACGIEDERFNAFAYRAPCIASAGKNIFNPFLGSRIGIRNINLIVDILC